MRKVNVAIKVVPFMADTNEGMIKFSTGISRRKLSNYATKIVSQAIFEEQRFHRVGTNSFK